MCRLSTVIALYVFALSVQLVANKEELKGKLRAFLFASLLPVASYRASEMSMTCCPEYCPALINVGGGTFILVIYCFLDLLFNNLFYFCEFI